MNNNYQNNNIRNTPPQINWWARFVAGGVSCMILSAVLNPMDVIKVRLQLQNQLSKVKIINFHSKNPYKGFFHAGYKIFLEEGFFGGLMKGITPSMIREATYSSLRLGFYDPIKNLLAPHVKEKNDFTLMQKILAGGISGALGSAIANPTDLVKIRFQSVLPGQTKIYKNTFHAFYKIFKDENGFFGLYKGVTATTIRASILTASQLSSYDHTKRFLLKNHYFNDGIYCHLVASIVSGLVTTTATNPVDIVKTRWMSQLKENKLLYSSPLDCFFKIIIKEGPHALFKGWIPNYLRFGPHFIVSLPLYEFLRKLLGADTI